MLKLRVTRSQYNTIINTYRIVIFILIVIVLILYSLLINKFAEFCIMFITYFITKNMYNTQYHSNSMKICFVISLFIFGISLTLCLDSAQSLICSALIGLLISFCSSYAGEIKQKLKDFDRLRKEELERNAFNVYSCSEEQLISKCKELKFNQRQIDFCIKAFIEQLTLKELAEYYCLEIQSVKNKKQIYKNKLNGK